MYLHVCLIYLSYVQFTMIIYITLMYQWDMWVQQILIILTESCMVPILSLFLLQRNEQSEPSSCFLFVKGINPETNTLDLGNYLEVCTGMAIDDQSITRNHQRTNIVVRLCDRLGKPAAHLYLTIWTDLQVLRWKLLYVCIVYVYVYV